MDVAVVVPVYNRRRRLRRAVESLLTQSRQPAAVFVVDDASTTDMSREQQWVEGQGLKWISSETNEGPGAARNRGANLSKTDWIAFLDSDDVWRTDKLEKQLSFHRSNPDIRLSHARERWIREGVEVRKPAHWEEKAGDLFEASCRRCSIGPSCVMIRRDLWNQLGGFDPRFLVCEDYELWLRATMHEAVGLVEGDPLVEKHGGHSDQLSTQVPAMDRYRVLALLKVRNEQALSSNQRETVESAIREKAGILHQGAQKRGLKGRGRLYAELLNFDFDAPPNSLDPLVQRLWKELVES